MWFDNLFDSLKPRRRRPIQPGQRDATRRRAAFCRLWVEALENRCVPAAMLTIGDLSVLEGNAGPHNAAVTVSLTEPHSNAVSANFHTADGTALASRDYNAVSGTLNFAKNEMSKTILVPIRGDRVVDPDEYFFVRLDGAKAGAKIASGQAVVTIVDDEPRISINDVSALEGNSGTTPFMFTVSLSSAYDLPVTINYATADGSANAGSDYTSASGTLNLAPGQTSRTIAILANADRTAEPDETFWVNVSAADSYAAISRAEGVGTLVDDEPRLIIGDVYNYGESTFSFIVNLSGTYDQAISINFATVDGTMIGGVDYVALSGTLTFAPGDTTETITIEVLDPTSVDTYFNIQLSGASTNALIANEWATGYSNYSYYDWYYYDYEYYYW